MPLSTKSSFDFHAYIERLTAECRLTRNAGYACAACSGIAHLEEVLANFRETSRVVAVSDVCDEKTALVGGAWFKRRLFTVFVTHPFTFNDMRSYREAMDCCREIYRLFQSRMLHDAQRAAFRYAQLNLADLRSQELGGTLLNGATGLLFMVTMDEPTDISYNPDEWITTG